VLAVEYLHSDLIDSVEDFVLFCESLIQTVDTLHVQSKLLHCDIKPDNIRWCKGVVRLIDFGHSQKIGNETFTRGTRGFEAPEILKRMPCSVKTDTYSVGKTILTVWNTLDEDVQQNQRCSSLHDIALKLADPDPTKRWSLSQALKSIQQIKKEGSCLAPLEELALIPNLISPG
jgi:serine/threonine-protein kinase PknG